jgi:hypothetical protein
VWYPDSINRIPHIPAPRTLAIKLSEPVHAQDGIKTKHVESVEVSWELDLVDLDGQISTCSCDFHFRGGGLYNQKGAQRGNMQTMLGSKTPGDEGRKVLE